jgi:putative addiction module CopG family antidote
MARTTTMTVRISGELSEFVAANVGEDGLYENVSEYVRDLIRRDKQRVDAEAFAKLKAELQQAFSVPEEEYITMTAEQFLERHRR